MDPPLISIEGPCLEVILTRADIGWPATEPTDRQTVRGAGTLKDGCARTNIAQGAIGILVPPYPPADACLHIIPQI